MTVVSADVISKALSGGKSAYLALKDDGDSEEVVFLGVPHIEMTVWTGEKTVEYDPREHQDAQPRRRFVINVLCKSDKEVKIFRMPFKSMATLQAKRAKKNYELNGSKPETDPGYQDSFYTCTWVVERHGVSGSRDTVYSWRCGDVLTEEQAGKIAKLDLHDLPGDPLVVKEEPEQKKSKPELDEIPF